MQRSVRAGSCRNKYIKCRMFVNMFSFNLASPDYQAVCSISFKAQMSTWRMEFQSVLVSVKLLVNTTTGCGGDRRLGEEKTRKTVRVSNILRCCCIGYPMASPTGLFFPDK